MRVRVRSAVTMAAPRRSTKSSASASERSAPRSAPQSSTRSSKVAAKASSTNQAKQQKKRHPQPSVSSSCSLSSLSEEEEDAHQGLRQVVVARSRLFQRKCCLWVVALARRETWAPRGLLQSIQGARQGASSSNHATKPSDFEDNKCPIALICGGGYCRRGGRAYLRVSAMLLLLSRLRHQP